MLSPNRYAVVHQLDLRTYYNDSGNQPMICELCRNSRSAPAVLRELPLAAPERMWYYCPRCSFSGTALDYLARLDGVQPVEILNRLLKEGTLTPLSDETIREYRVYCETAQTIRNEIHGLRPFDRSKSFRLAPLHELDDYFHVTKYRMGDRDEIERIFHRKSGRYNTSGSRLFRGRDWRDITVIPLYDMPLRMSALFFVNGDRNGSRSVSIRRLGPRQSGLHLFEPGYLATSEIVVPGCDTVVLSSDWLRVLRFQTRCYRHNKSIAPIVGWFPSDPRTEMPHSYKWSFFKNTKKIFWADREDVAALRETCLQKAFFSDAYYSVESGAAMRPDAVAVPMILNSVMGAARSWQDALTLYLKTEPDRVESRLSTLQLPQQVLEEYLADLSDLELARIIRERFFDGGETSCRVDNITVLGSRDGWAKQPRTRNEPPEPLSSARCLIDRAIRIGESEPLYEGRVLIGDEVHGDFPNAYLKCFADLLRHFSRFVLDREILSENWNSDMIHEGRRFLESRGLPVEKTSLFDAYYEPSSYFCDYITHLQQSEELIATQTEAGLEIPVGKLADCFYRHLDWWDFEGIKAMLAESMILKNYDQEKHVFLVDAEPFQTSTKRFHRIYQYPTG